MNGDVDYSALLSIGLTIFATLLALLASVHVLMTKRDSRSALAWLGFIIILPLVGPITYLIFGINRVREAAQETYRPAALMENFESISEPENTNFRPRSLVGESVTEAGLLSCEEIRILENGEACYPAMLRDIARAQRHIYCSTYIFQHDETGRQFIEAFRAARERGVKVKIIVDGLGGRVYPPQAVKALRESGCEFEEFLPITLIPPSLHINLRNHRKILSVDSRVAYTGGQNFSDRHLVNKRNNPKRARDLHFRLTGKIVDEFERTFMKDWNHAADIEDPDPFIPGNKTNPLAETWTRVIPDGPNDDLDKLTNLLVGVMSTARDRIWIMTPYFLPSFDLVGALVAADLRGVDVKIMLPERTNIHVAHWAALHNLNHILDRELKVYLQPKPFIHTKAIVIDDDYALVGSANMDPRSLRLNFELVVEVFSKAFSRELSQYFDACLAEATLLDKERLKALPYWMKVRNALAWLFSPYL